MAKVKFPWEKIEKLKKPIKLAIFFGTIVVLGALFFFLLYQPLQNEIASLEKEIEKLSTEVKVNRTKLKELDKVRARLGEVKLEIEYAKAFLPEKKEVPNLLRKISESAAESGLKVVRFQPQKEVEKDFYAEIPFTLEIEGPYLSVAVFMDRVGRLNRIVNMYLDEISGWQPKDPTPKFKVVDGRINLLTKSQGMTFRFLTEDEVKEREAKKMKDAAVKAAAEKAKAAKAQAEKDKKK